MRASNSSPSEAGADDAAALRERAIGLLARREHSRRELLDKLARRGCDVALAEVVVEQLASDNLQSDARFAELYVQQRVARGHGELRIRSELVQRGIAAELSDAALAAAEIDWFAAAERALEKKWRAGAPENDPLGRGMRFLCGRGFSHEQAREAVAALLAAQADE